MSDSDASPIKARTVEVAAGDAGQRVDNYLLRVLRGVPRTRVYRLLRRGEVRVNGGRVKPTRRLQAGDRVRLPPVRIERHSGGRLPEQLLESLRGAVLYEDEQTLVVDKPVGMAVHAGTGLGGGIIDGLRTIRPDIRGLELVHRLDRGTSGCLLLAKGRQALVRLQDELRAGAFEKVYRAVLLGEWDRREATVRVPLRKNVLSSGERMVRTDAAGKSAVSHFRRLAVGHGVTLVEVRIETGRTHQIRVHAAYLGHPVVGDPKYGDLARERTVLGHRAGRMYLHAARLGFTGADGPVTVDSPVPAAFAELVADEGDDA